MISAIIGTPFKILPGEIHIKTHGGVIYRVLYPVSEYSKLKKIEEVLLYTVFRIKDDKATLFGFLDQKEKELFEKMISISGVGGKTALSFMSAFSFDELSEAINNGDTVKLTSIPGVGKKTAQLIILKLTGKLDFKLVDVDDELVVLKEDLISALENLGYSKKNVKKIVNENIKNEDKSKSFEEAFRLILKRVQKTV